VIDFGGATYDWEHKSSIINTRQYRAPEVILGLGWSTPSDVWSLGCILMELYMGELLFQTHDNAEHLALMEAILGPFPIVLSMAQGREVRKYFDRHGRQRYPENAPSSDSMKHVRSAKRLEDIIHPRDTVFYDLIRQMLIFDPVKRIAAKDALNHRFFTGVRQTKDLPVPAYLPESAPRELREKLHLEKAAVRSYTPAGSERRPRADSRVATARGDGDRPPTSNIHREREREQVRPASRGRVDRSPIGRRQSFSSNPALMASLAISRMPATTDRHRDEYGRRRRSPSGISSPGGSNVSPSKDTEGWHSRVKAADPSARPLQYEEAEDRKDRPRYQPGDHPVRAPARSDRIVVAVEGPAHLRRRTDEYEPPAATRQTSASSSKLHSDLPRIVEPTDTMASSGSLNVAFHKLLQAPPADLERLGSALKVPRAGSSGNESVGSLGALALPSEISMTPPVNGADSSLARLSRPSVLSSLAKAPAPAPDTPSLMRLSTSAASSTTSVRLTPQLENRNLAVDDYDDL
jgi:serine/threonine protein kinase